MNLAPIPGKTCQAHVEQVPAVAYFRKRWRCAACMERSMGVPKKPATPQQRVFLDAYDTPKKLLPTQEAPKFRPYVQHQSITDAVERAMAYSWRTLPSLKP